MSLQEDSHANHTAQPESGLEKKMNATYGRRCLEQFERYNRAGLWAKTFAALLIGMEGWYSTKCKLTWKLSATKSHRFYFQLVPSTLPTEGIEFGLLLTPSRMEIAEHPDKYVERQKKRTAENKNGANPPGNKWNSLTSQVVYGFLQTPNLRDYKSPNRVNSTSNYSMLNETIHKALLPTPAMSNYKGASSTEALENRGRLKPIADNLADQFAVSGKSSQLNPRFVAEMMGFPPNWTELPFLNGETNQ